MAVMRVLWMQARAPAALKDPSGASWWGGVKAGDDDNEGDDGR